MYRISNGVHSRTVAGNGVNCNNNLFPVFKTEKDAPFVYQNCLEMNNLNYTIEGCYHFRYLREGEVPNDAPERIEDVDPKLLFKVFIKPFRLTLPTGQEFLQNPQFQVHMNTD